MKNLSIPFVNCLIVLSIAIGGCTPQKARALRMASMQFKAESLSCINAIDKMIDREIAPPPRSEEEIRSEFIDNILSTTRDLTPKIVDIAIDPDTVNLSPEALEAKNALVNDLRTQYTEFAAIFERLESGSFLAAPAVEKTENLAKKLTVQMANFAKIITAAPPEFLQSKNQVVEKIEDLRNEYQTLSSPTAPNEVFSGIETSSFATDTRQKEIETEIGELLGQWLQIKAEEQKLSEQVAKECLEAATIGQQVSVLIVDYDRLSINDIESVIFQAFDAASSISGLNFDSLKTKAKQISEFLNNDPFFKDVTVEISKQDLQQPNLDISDSLEIQLLQFPSAAVQKSKVSYLISEEKYNYFKPEKSYFEGWDNIQSFLD